MDKGFVLDQKRMPIAPKDVAAAVAFLRRDRHLGPVAQAQPRPVLGMRSRPFNSLIVAIAGQQISRTAAGAIMRRLDALAPMPFTAEELAKLRLPQLRGAGLSASKAACVAACARAFLAEDRLRRLGRLPDDEVREALTAIKGVGPWTAEMVLMFGLGRQDVMPHGDVGIIRGAARAFGTKDMDRAAARLRTTAPKWAPYRTVAAAYLWNLAA